MKRLCVKMKEWQGLKKVGRISYVIASQLQKMKFHELLVGMCEGVLQPSLPQA